MREATKNICKSSLMHNIKTLSALALKSKCVAVIKANAYGCEMTKVFDALNIADIFAVASIDEALILRKYGVTKSILLLEGVYTYCELSIAKRKCFEVVIASWQQLKWLLSFEEKFSRIWFKIDTGMGRLGFQLHDANAAMQQLLTKYCEKNIVLMTHFSDADNPDRSKTTQQIERFDDFAVNYPLCEQSLCASAGVLSYPYAHRDYIRPGISLYGASPFADNYGEDHNLEPVMTLKTKVLVTKFFKKGQAIGYGQTYRMQNNGYIAVCGIGYADGYSRFIPSNTPILINNSEYQVVGRISMDMTTVLVDDKVRPGDNVICWGKRLPIERISKAANTIPHQLLTGVTERPNKIVE